MAELTRQASTSGFKLHYFDFNGRGETPRMLFKLGGRPFEDVRYPRDQWDEIKPKTPQGTVPYLEKDGLVLGQSNAINRFLAKRFGLAGKSSWEEAQADMVVDTADGVWGSGAAAIIRAPDAEAKEEAIRDYLEKVRAVWEKVEGILKKNNEGLGYFVGNGLTWADVAVYNDLEFSVKVTGGALWEDFPLLAAFKERFEMEPKIEKHLETRPERPL